MRRPRQVRKPNASDRLNDHTMLPDDAAPPRARTSVEVSAPTRQRGWNKSLLTASPQPSAATPVRSNHARTRGRVSDLSRQRDSSTLPAAPRQPPTAPMTPSKRARTRVVRVGVFSSLRRGEPALIAALQPLAAWLCAWILLLGGGGGLTGCRSPGLVGQLCVGEDCPPSGECRDGSCEQQPECTLERCNAGLCSEAECTALRCAAGISGPACPEPCPGGVCTPVCTSASCPGASCDGGPCSPAACTGVDCPPVDSCDGGMCAPQSPGPDAGCDGGMCEPMAMTDCDADAGGCDAPSCETGPCIAAACDDCEPDPGCNEAFPICPSCRNDSDCGQGETQRCDVAQGRCVECLNASHCGGYEPFCIEGDCEECREDDDCIGRGLGRCRSGDCGF